MPIVNWKPKALRIQQQIAEEEDKIRKFWQPPAEFESRDLWEEEEGEPPPEPPVEPIAPTRPSGEFQSRDLGEVEPAVEVPSVEPKPTMPLPEVIARTEEIRQKAIAEGETHYFIPELKAWLLTKTKPKDAWREEFGIKTTWEKWEELERKIIQHPVTQTISTISGLALIGFGVYQVGNAGWNMLLDRILKKPGDLSLLGKRLTKAAFTREFDRYTKLTKTTIPKETRNKLVNRYLDDMAKYFRQSVEPAAKKGTLTTPQLRSASQEAWVRAADIVDKEMSLATQTGIPTMITTAMTQQLGKLGYSTQAILQMTPAIAQGIIKAGTPPTTEIPFVTRPTEVTPAVPEVTAVSEITDRISNIQEQLPRILNEAQNLSGEQLSQFLQEQVTSIAAFDPTIRLYRGVKEGAVDLRKFWGISRQQAEQFAGAEGEVFSVDVKISELINPELTEITSLRDLNDLMLKPSLSDRAVSEVVKPLWEMTDDELLKVVDIDLKARVIRYPKGGRIVSTYPKELNYKEGLDVFRQTAQKEGLKAPTEVPITKPPAVTRPPAVEVAKPLVEPPTAPVTPGGRATYEQVYQAIRMARMQGMTVPELHKMGKDLVGVTHLRDMTNAQITRLITELGSPDIKLPITGVSSQLAKRGLDALGLELSEHLGKVPPKPSRITKETVPQPTSWEQIKDLKDDYLARSLLTDNILRRADNYQPHGKMIQAFSDPVENATDRKLMNLMAFDDRLQRLIKDRGIDLARLLATKQEVLPGLTLTSGEKIGIAIQHQDPNAARHIQQGNQISEDEMMAVVDSLSDAEKAIVDWWQGYAKELGPRVAEAYNISTGKTLKLVENYLPLIPKGTNWEVGWESIIKQEAAYRFARRWPAAKIKKQFVQPRRAKAIQPIELDFFDIIARRMPEIEHYTQFAPVIRDLSRLYNHPRFKASFIEKANARQYNVLGEWIESAAATNPYGLNAGLDKFLRVMRTRAIPAIAGLNLVMAPKAFVSFLLGAAELGNIDAMRGLAMNTTNPKKIARLIKRYSPQIYNRVYLRELGEIKRGQSVHDIMLKKTPLRQKIMILYSVADRTAVSGLWAGQYFKAIREGKPPTEAGKLATNLIRRTQPVWNVKDVAQFQRSGEGMKMLTAFTNQLFRNFNYITDDVLGMTRAGAQGKGRAAWKLFEGIILTSLIIGIISSARLPRSPREIAEWSGGNMIATIPLVGRWIASGMKGFKGSGTVTTELLEQFQELAYSMNKGNWDRLWTQLPAMAGYATGMPVTQPRRMFSALIAMAEGRATNWMDLIWGAYNREPIEGREERPKGWPKFPLK